MSVSTTAQHSKRIPPPRQPIQWFGRKSPLPDLIMLAIVFPFIGWVIYSGAAAMGYNWQWYRVPEYIYRVIDGEFIPGPLLRGLWMTLEITLYSILIALVLGLIVALLRRSGSRSGSFLATAYLELIRNTPLLVQVSLFYFVLRPIIDISPFWTGVIALAVYEGAFAAEIIRAGLESVSRGQTEAGKALGFTPYHQFRDIVLPQAIPIMLPPMANLLISLIKSSAILIAISIAELTTQASDAISESFLAFEIWFTVAAMYLAVTLALSVCVSLLEKRVQKYRQR
ncbi:MAG: amino acid ABC transporter permease [Thiolinea sp.]